LPKVANSSSERAGVVTSTSRMCSRSNPSALPGERASPS
jgi:hypothetical protein